MNSTITLLDGERTTIVDRQIDAAALAEATGWLLKPEGLCKGDVCVPVRDRDALVRDGVIDLAAFAAALHRPLVIDEQAGIAALGERATEVGEQLRSLHAPDFTLPDLNGTPHTFSSIGRKKKLLFAWASW